LELPPNILASPKQAEINQLAIDTRNDIHSHDVLREELNASAAGKPFSFQLARPACLQEGHDIPFAIRGKRTPAPRIPSIDLEGVTAIGRSYRRQ
jgi:hypothetical protein